MRPIGKLGRDEGRCPGPEPGDGADLGHMPDMEGTAPDELPPRSRDESRPDPVKSTLADDCNFH
jgi:hypothetical protein